MDLSHEDLKHGKVVLNAYEFLIPIYEPEKKCVFLTHIFTEDHPDGGSVTLGRVPLETINAIPDDTVSGTNITINSITLELALWMMLLSNLEDMINEKISS